MNFLDSANRSQGLELLLLNAMYTQHLGFIDFTAELSGLEKPTPLMVSPQLTLSQHRQDATLPHREKKDNIEESRILANSLSTGEINLRASERLSDRWQCKKEPESIE